jgi:hypothetical protein
LKLTSGETAARQAEGIRNALAQIADEGAAALPAISRFLQTHEDLDFPDPAAATAVGYSTLRIAFLDILVQIDGPEAEAVLVDQLKTTAEPFEVEVLADMLEERSPGYYREPVIQAVRETLRMIARGPSSEQDAFSSETTDAAPLFNVLQKYPDEKSVAELERMTSTWEQYAPLSLGNLPDGQGIPYLVRMVRSPTALEGSRGKLAMRILARDAADDFEARDALIEKVRADEIPASFWPLLAETIAGDHQLQIENPENEEASIGSTKRENPYSTYTVSGRRFQKIYSVHRSAVLTQGEAIRRLDLIDKLYEEVSDPAAQNALTQAASLLYR